MTAKGNRIPLEQFVALGNAADSLDEGCESRRPLEERAEAIVWATNLRPDAKLD